MPCPRACPTRVLWRCPSFGKTGTQDCILLFRRRARCFPGENDSAVSFQLDQHKSRCCDHMSLGRCDRPRAAAQNKSRAALRSAYKIAGKAGIRCDHPATLSTSGLGNQIVLEMRPLDRRQYSLVIVRPKPACWQILSWKTDARRASGKQMEHRSPDLCAQRSYTPLKSSGSSFCCSRGRRPRSMLFTPLTTSPAKYQQQKNCE